MKGDNLFRYEDTGKLILKRVVTLANPYTQLKKIGISLVFEGPQKFILNLFKQYNLEE